MKTKIFDLTPPISAKLAVFPGDQPFERLVALSMAQGAHLELSAMRTTLHLGAHADAPSHYGLGSKDIAQRPISRYLGKAQVLRVSGMASKSRVGLSHLGQRKIEAERVLVDTQSFPNPNQWSDDFCAFAPELLQKWAEQGVRLVGIDTPSVDLSDSKDLPAHQVLLKNDLAVLEGLVLKDVPEGIYTLIALPLPILDGDASPVRAVLLPHCPQLDELAE